MTTNKQTTLQQEVECNGIGLHSGKPVEMKLKPAPINTGIVFIRTDLLGKPHVRAITENITGTLRATTLKENGAAVSTIEHLLAAFAMEHVDNWYVEMSSIEPPVGDGSAEAGVEAVQKAVKREQAADRVVYAGEKEFT